MTKGATVKIALVVERPVKFAFPWTHQLWIQSQIPAHDEVGPFGPNWFQLFSGATATIQPQVNCGTAPATTTAVMPKLY
jgi:hypothetical protein